MPMHCDEKKEKKGSDERSIVDKMSRILIRTMDRKKDECHKQGTDIDEMKEKTKMFH